MTDVLASVPAPGLASGPDVPRPAPSGPSRLLGRRPDVPLPHVSADQLVALTEAAGLTGRGGAGFPTARKLRSVAGRSPVVVGNAMEGEPLSSKDAVLLAQAPHLVVDGLSLLGAALGASRVLLATGPEVAAGPAREAARGTRVEVRALGGGFVAGQESALVRQLDGGPAVPTDPLVPVFRRGVGGRPTLVLNAETLAQLALLARHGADWFREQGTPADPGTFLVTLSGSSADLLTHPGVLEVARGTSLRTVLEAGGTRTDRVRAVLVGGYHGAWVPATDLDVPLDREHLAPFGATPGAGVVHALDRAACPLAAAAEVARYLAGQSARQCGPCVNGLPRMADLLEQLARPGADPGLVPEVQRVRRLVTGRGACAHPDGSARFVASTLTTFAPHVEDHLRGGCHEAARRLDPL
ncbi:NADH:ubiquinone oxidoreductase, NADH-binding subunit (chain F) [Nocardioides scoriae]|uniref:NADH:ubiquinone oxidoreductase, NADH-binding subunit (Chain F) n=1 Tax=Nocardioides scoriae TaxID=642780 RepID=A0A1H1T5Q8_9ACTN|nr:NADH-ubiquinone oxidoreductase-F iron-sulfur binding region domain-containing protein [Nocardioides scoriae]SDS55494.1 NADH:ubiquinone oxidoreductase, NADH-binding subunit (chain F) [Nocardioides scoriae]